MPANSTRPRPSPASLRQGLRFPSPRQAMARCGNGLLETTGLGIESISALPRSRITLKRLVSKIKQISLDVHRWTLGKVLPFYSAFDGFQVARHFVEFSPGRRYSAEAALTLVPAFIIYGTKTVAPYTTKSESNNLAIIE